MTFIRQSFGRYELLGEIARGGMAEVVYAAKRPTGDTLAPGTRPPLVALKRILANYAQDPGFRRYFAAEIDLARTLQHPNVVETLDWGEVDGAPFLVMEYIHGRSLSRINYAIASQGKRLPLPYAVHVIVQALEGLDHVHTAVDASGRPLDIILCDISLSNIMVGYDGRVKLIDFGIATSRIKFSEQIGLLKGKKNYMGPEQLRGLPLDQRADLFSIGICLFELLASQSPFAGKSEFEVEETVRTGLLSSLAEKDNSIPPPLRAVLSRALSAEPNDRFQTAREFAEALRPFARLGSGGSLTQAALAKVLALLVGQMLARDHLQLQQVLSEQSLAGQTAVDEKATIPGMSVNMAQGDITRTE